MVHLQSVNNVITLGKLIGLLFLFCLPFLLLHTKNTKNELTRLVMGNIFLVYSETCQKLKVSEMSCGISRAMSVMSDL